MELQRAEGEPPTVARAAEAAGVSRATAYRYFPTQESLTLELSDVTPKVAGVEAMLERLEGPDVEQRLLTLLDEFNTIALAEQRYFRRAMWVAQDTWLRSDRAGEELPAVREGRRMRWLDRVLEPVADDLPPDRRARLQAALALTIGIDSLTIMKDICGLDNEEALDVLRWTARALLRAGLEPDAEGP